MNGFIDEMSELGYQDDRNIVYRFAERPVQDQELAALLETWVSEKVDLVFTAGTPTGVAAHKATEGTDIPVIFGVIADPVAAGVVDDPSRPGSNMTGVMIVQNQAKRLELLTELDARIRIVFVPFNPDDSAPSSALAQIVGVAPSLGLSLLKGHARNDEEVSCLIDNVPESVDAVFMLPDSTVNRRVADLVAKATEMGIPVSGPSMIQVEQGAVMAYGIMHENAGRQAARIADRVLRGASPAELPVESASFYLGLNLPAADAIGLSIPYRYLQMAEVIVRNE